MKYVLFVLFGIGMLTSCRFLGGKRVNGNGTITTESRQPGNFTGVRSYGSFDVTVTTDSSPSVKIECDENLLQYIVTSVEDGNLKITTAHRVNVNPSKDIKVYVSAPVFHELGSSGSGKISSGNQIISDQDLEVGISGSGDIVLDLKAKNVSADISGSGSITLSGNATKLSSSIAGDGDIKAAKLQTEESSVKIAGSGNAVINASRQLNVEIAGSGDVKYIGSPAISQHVAGSGNIERLQQ